MDSSQTTSSEWTETQYEYRYFSRRLLIISVLSQAMVVLVIAWLAVAHQEVWLWLCGAVSFLLFLFYVRLAILDTRNQFIIRVSPTGISLPIFWKRGGADFLPFSSLSGIELIKARKTTILKFLAGKKMYFVSEIYFPQKQDFKELLARVQKYAPIPFSGGSM